MSKLLLTLNGNPSNMHSSQLFDDQAHLESWIAHHRDETKLLPNAILTGTTLTCGDIDDKGNIPVPTITGVIETKDDDFTNDPK